MESILQKWTPQGQGEREELLAAARQCERAARAVGTQEEMAEVMKVLAYQEQMQTAFITSELAKYAQTSERQEERLPLRCEGDDIGRVEARIPAKLFFGLFKQKNFGHDGFTSDDGMRDFGRQYPQFMVKTVSGRTTVGYEGKASRKGSKGRKGVNFGRGTMEWAN